MQPEPHVKVQMYVIRGLTIAVTLELYCNAGTVL